MITNVRSTRIAWYRSNNRALLLRNVPSTLHTGCVSGFKLREGIYRWSTKRYYYLWKFFFFFVINVDMILKKNYIIIIIEIVMKVNEILKKNVHYFNIHMLNLILRYFYNKILRRNCFVIKFSFCVNKCSWFWWKLFISNFNLLTNLILSLTFLQKSYFFII